MSDFKAIYISNNKGHKIFIDQCFKEENSCNLIFCCTPIDSVVKMKKCYQPFITYGFNIYAIDFTGIGKSEGDITEFSGNSVIEDFNSCIKYIKNKSNKPIFLFGDTGIGGIFAQYFISTTTEIKAFAQYGVGIHGDVSPLKYSTNMVKMIYPVIKLMANIFSRMKVTMSIPKYNGFNAELDNQFYEDLIKANPTVFKTNIKIIKTLLSFFLEENSSLKIKHQIPTLVFKTTHDRYFHSDYFDKYYNNLICEKKLFTIDDVHNSYYFYADLLAKEVSDWFVSHVHY